ncbi:FtsX-like permease family protein [candidate division WOR-3 bacterium]|uniref:FtsX-like permease family protein n=1 Tax=candidate division WOR-3 bacterium TaxID=2052148 RepID=A0A9D5KB28_UNCW3|nr:FtsX-like permease family protein [candidate division WOR-3 bacterium]MBD3364491.1 FtsX-like permease family protein [candidate division WOR-3 bacterium]
MNVNFFIASRYLRQRRRGEGFYNLISIIAIAGVFVGVAALIITLSVFNGFNGELKDRIAGVFPHIEISKYGNAPITVKEYQDTIAPGLSKMREVTGFAPVVNKKTAIQFRGSTAGVSLTGVRIEDLPKMSSITNPSYYMEGEWSFANHGAVVGTELAANLGLRVGDTIIVVAPDREPIMTPLGVPVPIVNKFEIRGIFDAGFFDYNLLGVFIDLQDAQLLFGHNRTFTNVEVKLKDPLYSPKVVEKIQNDIGFPFVWVTDWLMQNKNLFSALKMQKVVVFIVLTLIILVAAFNIIGTLIMTVMRKTREIGILRAIGMKSAGVMKVFTFFGLLIGFIGTILGTIFGVFASLVLDRFKIIRLPADVWYIDTVPVRVQGLDVAVIAVTALLITFLASIYPAFRASRMDPVEAVRYE